MALAGTDRIRNEMIGVDFPSSFIVLEISTCLAGNDDTELDDDPNLHKYRAKGA